MDMLFKRYACPFSLLDEMIKNNSLSDFVSRICKKYMDETDDQRLWEFYLHRVFDKSFDDFKNEVMNHNTPKKPIDFEATINESYMILEGFNPSE